MNKSVYLTYYPIIWVCLVTLTCCTVTLLLSQFFYAVFATIIVIGLLMAQVFKNKRTLVFVLLLIALVSSLCSYNAYVKGEKNANVLAEKYKDKAHTFCAKVEKCSSNGKFSTFILDLYEINGNKTDTVYKAKAYSFSQDYADAQDVIVFDAVLKTVDNIESDGFDTAMHLKSQNIFLYFPEITVKSSFKTDDKDIFTKIRDFVNECIYKYLPINYDYTSAYIAKALVLGDTSDIPKQIKAHYTRSGLTHILSVSGMHISIIMMFSSFVVCKLIANKKISCVILLLVCAFYVVLSGLHVSAIRAGLMTAFSSLAVIFRRKTDATASLFLSAIVICIFDPYTVFDVSAILSFLSTFGIICSMTDTTNESKKSKGIVNVLKTAVRINVFAVTFTVPVVICSFGTVSLVSVVSTLAVSYVCTVVMVLLFCLVLLGAIPNVSVICTALGYVCSSLIDFMNYVAQFFSSFKYACVDCDNNILFTITFAVLLMVLTLSVSFGDGLVKKMSKYGIVAFSMFIVILSLVVAINKDKSVNIHYYHKSMSDTQISIKTGTEGYLLVNWDNALCTDSDKLPFDTFSGRNSLLVMPDDKTDAKILSENIQKFSLRFGLEHVFVPDTQQGRLLGQKLYENNIQCLIFPKMYVTENSVVSISDKDENICIWVLGENINTKIVISDEYDEKLFTNGADVCAYFPKTSNARFDVDKDVKPVCKTFYTRLSKNQTIQGIVNTYGKQSFALEGCD